MSEIEIFTNFPDSDNFFVILVMSKSPGALTVSFIMYFCFSMDSDTFVSFITSPEFFISSTIFENTMSESENSRTRDFRFSAGKNFRSTFSRITRAKRIMKIVVPAMKYCPVPQAIPSAAAVKIIAALVSPRMFSPY